MLELVSAAGSNIAFDLLERTASTLRVQEIVRLSLAPAFLLAAIGAVMNVMMGRLIWVADRIERVARAVGDPRRVIAGTDCGFDTSAGMGRVAEDVVWAKLRAMRDAARIATERLF